MVEGTITVTELRECVSKVFQAFAQPMQSEQVSDLAKALCEMQYEVEGARKDSNNPFFKSKYADLESCMDALREPMHNHGLSVSQTTGFKGNVPVLITTLMHSSGQWIKGELSISPAKQNDPQSQGSALTYARRYGLCAITGLVQVDDDGNSASGKQNNPKTSSESANPKQDSQKATSSSTSKGGVSPGASTAQNQKQNAEQKDAGKTEGKSVSTQESSKAAGSEEQENASVAGSAGGSTASASGSKSAESATATAPVTGKDMGDLMRDGMSNGWNRTQLSLFVCEAFNLTPETVMNITRKQFETAKALVKRPENKEGKVTHDMNGKPLAPEHCFPKGGK